MDPLLVRGGPPRGGSHGLIPLVLLVCCFEGVPRAIGARGRGVGSAARAVPPRPGGPLVQRSLLDECGYFNCLVCVGPAVTGGSV